MGPEPAITVGPDPTVPGLGARAPSGPVRPVTPLVGAEGLPADEVRQLLRVGGAAVEVQARVLLGTSVMMTARMMMMMKMMMMMAIKWTVDT